MEDLTKRAKDSVSTLTKQKNTTLKFFGITTMLLGAYIVYLGSNNDSIIDAEYTIIND